MMLLSVREAAALLGVKDERTVRRLVPTVRVGRQHRIQLADIRRLIESGKGARHEPRSSAVGSGSSSRAG
jgi:excisionase family DNA binding protein